MIDAADRAEAYWESTVKRARQEHHCDECRRTIEPGESYQRTRAIWEGEPIVTKACGHCVAAREWLVRVCRGFVHSMVLEELREHWDHSELYRSWWLGRAIVGMRRKWRRKDGTLMPVLGEPPVPRPQAA